MAVPSLWEADFQAVLLAPALALAGTCPSGMSVKTDTLVFPGTDQSDGRAKGVKLSLVLCMLSL
jgi:hypothetical protein